MALTPEISHALAEIANGLELTPELREQIIDRVPDGAQTEADLPEDMQWLLGEIRKGAPEPVAASGRTLQLAGASLTFSTAVMEPTIAACDDRPHPPRLDPDDDGTELLSAALPQHWRGQLVPYNIAAPDGRIIKSPNGDPKSREMPLPLSAQVASADGHDNAVLVGRVNRIWTQDGSLWGEGEFDLGSPEGRDWAGRIGRGMAGWGSVDLDAGSAPRVESQGRNKVPKRTYNDWSFAGYTLVSRPAFDSSRISAFYDNDDVIDDERNGNMPEHVERALAPLLDVFAGDEDTVVNASNGNCGCGGSLEDDEVAQSFPGGGKSGLPMGAPTDWDSSGAEKRMRVWAGVDKSDATPADWAKYGQGFFWHAPSAAKFGDFKLPFADVVDGKLVAMPRGIFAAAASMEGSRGQKPDIPEGDVNGVKSKISGYYRALKRKAPWDSGSMTAALTNGQVYTSDGITGIVTGFDDETGWLRISCGRDADLIMPADDLDAGCLTASAISGPVAPPDEWFANPNLAGPTGLSIDDDGRVYGHLATWGTCHLQFTSTCVTAPRSNTSYSYFHTGEVVTASGKRIPVGKIVIGPGHAGPYAGWRAATAHYDKGGSSIVVARAGEDAYGIWIAGAVVPEAKPAQVAALRRSPLSGDWRKIGGSLELVAALAVSVPGFPVPRPRAGIAYSQQTSLVAAGVVDRSALETQASMLEMVEMALENVLESYAARRQRAAAALAKIEAASDCGCESHDEDEDDTELAQRAAAALAKIEAASADDACECGEDHDEEDEDE